MGFGLLKRRNRDFSSDSWKVVKELFQRVPTLGVVNERMNRDARAGEDGAPPRLSGSNGERVFLREDAASAEFVWRIMLTNENAAAPINIENISLPFLEVGPNETWSGLPKRGFAFREYVTHLVILQLRSTR